MRRLIEWSARSDPIYRILWFPVIRMAVHALRINRWQTLGPEADVHALFLRLSPDATVLDGPFAGLRYPGIGSTGSMFYPKILGCYEAELHTAIEELLGKHYTQVIDIGCAEGYYAIGFARRLPKATVFAYDSNLAARAMCESMAAVNGVQDRVHIGGLCRPELLRSNPSGGRRLIISDCEGGEKNLFDPATCEALRKDDLIIEIHDAFDPTISSTLLANFSATHAVTRIPSVTDFARPMVYPVRKIAAESRGAQIALMAELRGFEMEWFVCRSRTSIQN